MKSLHSIILLLAGTLGVNCFLFQFLTAQTQKALLNEDHTITIIETLEKPPFLGFRNDAFGQMAGFPKSALASKTFKNLRNVTLVDLDGNRTHEILWGADSQLFAHAYDTLLWQRSLSGTVIFPPSVADLDNNGIYEIAQATGGSQTDSRIYLLDENGQDLPGWPLNFDGHWIITAPALADVDEDGVREVIFNERDSPENRLHIVELDGTALNDNWPVAVPGNLAVTPSVGDVDQDGEKEIYVTSTTSRYLFQLNGELETGWPQETGPDQRYSFQSPILVDLNQNGNLEIVGASHGDLPQYYVLQADGSNLPGWPRPVPENVWTFSTPTVVTMNGILQILASRPIGESFKDMLYGWTTSGELLPGFPILQSGGLEGIISVADVDGDEEFELLFGSNLRLEDGRSFIHAYEMDGSVVDGFPIRPYGWTYMNGVAVGDVNGDERMDLVALSYIQKESQLLNDSIYLNVYELNVLYSPERVLWSTYKGSNARNGLITREPATSVKEIRSGAILSLHPNPVKDGLTVTFSAELPADLQYRVYNTQGQVIKTSNTDSFSSGLSEITIPVDHIPPGVYYLRVCDGQKEIGQVMKFVKL